MNEILMVIFAIVVIEFFIFAANMPYPFDFVLKRKIKEAALFARDHHAEADVDDWRWQEFREALVFWFNWGKRHAREVQAEYHELFVLNDEGEAVDVVPPANLWRGAIHLGLIEEKRRGRAARRDASAAPATSAHSPA